MRDNFIKTAFASLFLLSVMVLLACSHSPTNVPITQVCFTNDVLPIFQGSCSMAGCHAAPRGKGHYILDNYAGIMAGITPGNAFGSTIYKAITKTWFSPMPPPPHNPLTQDQRTLIEIWILQGAHNDSCSTK